VPSNEPVGAGGLAPEPRLELLFEIDADATPESGAGVLAEGGDWLPERAFVHDWARHALGATVSEPVADTRHELSVRLVSSGTMRTLNRDWRGRDTPTNVLSFPSGLPMLATAQEGPEGGAHGVPSALSVLGDLALCPALIAREALAQGKPGPAHWAHLIVHGVLHLRGFDHVDAAGADAMERLEIRLLSVRDIPDPYGARPSSS